MEVINGIRIIERVAMENVEGALFIGTMITLVSFLCFLLFARLDNALLNLLFGIGIAFGLLFVLLGDYVFKFDEKAEWKYLVEIEDSCSMTEFDEKYEIVEEVGGNIYWIKSKENGE